MFKGAICIIFTLNELETETKSMVFFPRSPLPAHCLTWISILHFYIPWGINDVHFLSPQLMSKETTKKKHRNSVPTVISWHRFLHAKIMWIYDIVFWMLTHSILTVQECYILSPFIYSFFALHVFSQQKLHENKVHHHHLLVTKISLRNTLCLIRCSRSRNLCIHMYKRWINWMCKKNPSTRTLVNTFC